jgi:hypothetical protein
LECGSKAAALQSRRNGGSRRYRTPWCLRHNYLKSGGADIKSNVRATRGLGADTWVRQPERRQRFEDSSKSDPTICRVAIIPLDIDIWWS